MSFNSLQENNSVESAPISPEVEKNILLNFHELLSNPDIAQKVRAKVGEIPDQIKKMQILQSLNRILRIEDAASAIKESTTKRLHHLMTSILIKDVTPQV